MLQNKPFRHSVSYFVCCYLHLLNQHLSVAEHLSVAARYLFLFLKKLFLAVKRALKIVGRAVTAVLILKLGLLATFECRALDSGWFGGA